VFGKTGQVIGDFIHFVIDGQKVRFPKSMSDTQIEQAINNKVRLKRAEEQGFDTSQTYYHGTGADFDAFRKDYGGVYFTDSPSYADRYTTRNGETGRNIIPTHLKLKNTFDTRNPKHRKIYNEQFLNKYGNGTPLRDDSLPDWVEADDFQEFFKSEGLPFDSAIVGEPPTIMPDGSFRPEKSLLVTNEKNIRSINAQFKDPDSRNLLASAAGLGVLKGADYAYSQDEGQDTQAGVITKGGKKLIEAWHGTPHSFDKFDINKIGTGEGAQAYGHGLYSADSRGVAEGYKEQLSLGNELRVNGEVINDSRLATDILTDSVSKGKGLSEAKRQIQEVEKTTLFDPKEVRQAKEIIFDLEGKEFTAGKAKGSLYQLEIDATPDELLDWDKPLSEQSQQIQDALKDLDPDMYHPKSDDYDAMEKG
ncbi:MAG: hypothetical protein GY820_31220, partial [Gammaproteobacteria bacterium]|nr:hypothetical protein [Gammaproteobacteria bacterium]